MTEGGTLLDASLNEKEVEIVSNKKQEVQRTATEVGIARRIGGGIRKDAAGSTV